MNAATVAAILNAELEIFGYDMREVVQKDYADGLREFRMADTNELLFATRNLGDGRVKLIKPAYRIN